MRSRCWRRLPSTTLRPWGTRASSTSAHTRRSGSAPSAPGRAREVPVPDDPKMLIGGEWVDSASGATFEATSPSTGEVIARVPEGVREDAQRAIAAANAAWRDWASRSAFERAVVMRKMAEIVGERRDDLARTLSLDQGKPLRAEAHDEVEELIAYFEMASADATRMEGLIPPSVDAGKRVFVYRVPRGVVGVISPWNWPFTMPGELLAPALAFGNAVVWVPAPSTSVCAVKLAQCIEDAGLPPGVLNMVTGPGPVVGDEIASNPGTHAVGFIGSIATGHRVAERAAGKELLLEMGGNGPLVILEDADLDAAVAGTLTACFLNAGQSCTAGETDPGPRVRPRRVPGEAPGRYRRRDPPGGPVRRRDDDGSLEQRARGGQDGAARRRRGGPGGLRSWWAGSARRTLGASCSSRPPWSTARPKRWRSPG